MRGTQKYKIITITVKNSLQGEPDDIQPDHEEKTDEEKDAEPKTVTKVSKETAGCIGTAREIRVDCPLWSEWLVDMDACGYLKNGLFASIKQMCERDHNLGEFRECRVSFSPQSHWL